MRVPSDHVDAIVVGAGLSGLKAAIALKRAGRSVRVLEARTRVGGRAMAGEIAGQTVDFGGQWVGPQHSVLHDQARELGVETCPQYEQGKNLLSRNGAVTAYGATPKLPLTALLELAFIEWRWKRDIATLPQGAPWLAKQAVLWDALTIDRWSQAHVRTEAAREFIRTVIGALLCADTRQASYLFMLEMLRAGGGVKVMTGVGGGAQQDKFVGGAWQIPSRMADELEGMVELGNPVLAIAQDGDGVRVTAERGVYHGSHVIVAVPPPLAAQMDFTPPLPAKRAALLKGMKMGAVIKIHVSYDTPFWRHQGLSGSVVSSDRHLATVFDQSLGDDGPGVLVGLIEAGHARTLSAMDADDRRKQVIADLVHYFGPDAAHPAAYAEHDWIREEWSLGGYAAYMSPGVMTSSGPSLRERCGRIHWAGTETASEFTGYFEGALRAGERAAQEVLQAG